MQRATTRCSLHRPLLLSGLRCCYSNGLVKRSDEAQVNAARQWLRSFNPETLPKSIGEVSFSRSSGPGGQNVNKVSSKATLRVPVPTLLASVPDILHVPIKSSRYVAGRSNDIVIQADESRKANDNATACYRKLYEMILQAGKKVVPGETSPEQVERVKRLQAAEATQRRKMKEHRNSKKSARRGSSDD